MRKCPDMTKRYVRGIKTHMKYVSQSKGKGRMERGKPKPKLKAKAEMGTLCSVSLFLSLSLSIFVNYIFVSAAFEIVPLSGLCRILVS